MALVINIDEITHLYSANQYPTSNDEAHLMGLTESCHKEMRAMTIAAFRVAQNSDQLSQKKMSKELVRFLLADSESAINHWLKKNRINEGADFYILEPAGIVECQNSLAGLVKGYSTTEAIVHDWTERMINGDEIAVRSKSIETVHWY